MPYGTEFFIFLNFITSTKKGKLIDSRVSREILITFYNDNPLVTVIK